MSGETFLLLLRGHVCVCARVRVRERETEMSALCVIPNHPRTYIETYVRGSICRGACVLFIVVVVVDAVVIVAAVAGYWITCCCERGRSERLSWALRRARPDVIQCDMVVVVRWSETLSVSS